MSLADRMKILKDKEEQWKNKGKGAANDSVQFTVAGRMAKRGNVESVFTLRIYTSPTLLIVLLCKISVLLQHFLSTVFLKEKKVNN